MQKLIFLFPLLLSFSLYAQNGPNNPLSVRSNGVANASVTFNDINSLFNNQAGLANLENISFLASGQETFKNPDSDNLGIGFAMPTSFGSFGIQVHFFERENFDQTKIGLAYARKLTDKISLGVQFDLLSNQFEMYDRSNLFTFEIGFQAEVSENLLVGIHFNNPAKLEIIEDEFLPIVLRIGATYSFSKKLLFHAEIEKDFDFPLVFKAGLEWELGKDFWLRIGMQRKPTNINFGIGYKFKNGLRIDMAAYYQKGIDLISSGPLGSTDLIPSFGLGYDLVKK